MSAINDTIDELLGLRRRVAELEAQVEARSPRLSIVSEPLTYEARLVRDKNGPQGFRAVSTRENHSYVRDFIIEQTRGDQNARERLQRHAREMEVIGEARERVFHPDVEVDFEQRAVNWTNGQGGYFAPPLWIVEQFAYQPTPERVLSKLAPQFELPVGAQSVNLPAWSAGAEMGVTPLTAAPPSTSTIDTAISSAVVTIAGNYDVPIQMLEQSPQGAHLDWVAFTTMEARYGYQLEQQLIIGTGAAVPQGSGNNQLLGIYNNPAIPAANIISYTGTGQASPGTTGSLAQGATSMFSYLGFAISKIGQARFLPPEAWLMSTSRVGWIGSSEDNQNRPLMIADRDGSGAFDLIAIPVYWNDAIPRTSGTNANEDRVICCRPSDWLILESERRTNVSSLRRDSTNLRRDNAALGDAMGGVLSGTLQVRLQMRRYVAALLRYPTSVAYLQGSGMATSGGW